MLPSLSSLLFAAPSAAEGNSVGLLMIVAVFAIFYFLLILPTQRRQKKVRQMHQALKAGDRVVTTGGIHGTVVSVRDNFIHLRVPPDQHKLEVLRSAVAQVEPEGGAADEAKS